MLKNETAKVNAERSAENAQKAVEAASSASNVAAHNASPASHAEFFGFFRHDKTKEKERDGKNVNSYTKFELDKEAANMLT